MDFQKIDRRAVLASGVAGAALLSFPEMAAAGLDASNTVAWHGKNTTDHKALMDKWALLGFRTKSLSIYGDTGNPLYACVMIKRAAVHAEWTVYPRTQAGVQADFDAWAKKGYGPYIVTATGPRSNPVFAMSFRPMSGIPLTRLNLSKDEFQTLNAQQHAAGNILGWVDVFGTADDPGFAAIWVANPNRVAWSIDGYDIPTARQEFLEDYAHIQARFEAVRSSWGRPAFVSAAPGERLVEMYTDDAIGAWVSRGGLTADAYQAEFDKQTKAGLFPIQVSAEGSGAGARFAAIFASREETDPRTMRSNGPVKVDAVDAIIEDLVKTENLRGASLAICKGTQLVYARGYTYAEPGYPDITPQTPIRQASVSKTFTGVAMWRLLQDNPNISLGTKVNSILKLKQPDGSAPKSAYWNDVTIQHLLESDSGLPQWLIYGSDATSQAFNNTLPVHPPQLLSYAASLDFESFPGNTDYAVYGNFDYIVLGQLIATLAGEATYEAALKKLVLDPLHQSHTRLARSLIGDQQPGEARHHMTVYDTVADWKLYPFEVLQSERTSGKPLVPTHYGNLDFEMFSSAGGLSSSAVDMARLGAMFSCRVGNPVLKPDQIDTMLQAVGAAGAKLWAPDGKGGLARSHGYYGLDWCNQDDPANHVYTAQKGGWLPGQGTILQFTTGGYTYALAYNGNADVNYDWLTPLDAVAKAQPWGPTDLFKTEYNMPTLIGQLAGPFKFNPKGPIHAPSLVKASMTKAWKEHGARRRSPPPVIR